MKGKSKRKRGYSLVELTIAMVVTIVLMSSIISLVAAVLKESERSTKDYGLSSELLLARQGLYTWFNSFAGYESGGEEYKFVNDLESGYEGVNVYKDGEVVSSIYFDDLNRKLVSDDFGGYPTFSLIYFMTFDVYDDNVIKVSILYDGCRQPIVYLFSGKDFSDD